MGRSTKGPITAGELIAERDRDAEYQRRSAARKDKEDQESQLLRDAERPLVADLAAVGVKTDSVWNLYKVPNSRPAAIPVLIEHMGRDYPTKVYLEIGQALNDPSARPWWPQMKEMYLSTKENTVRDRLASVLGTIAVKAHYEDLLSFLADESLGSTRIYFVRPVNRIGNRMSPGQGRKVIEKLADDATLGAAAKQVLAGRSRNS